MLRLGLMKLERYVKENDFLDLFNECDTEGNGYLDKRGFNKLLISTDIKELGDRNIRHVLIKKLFSYYKNEKMTLDDFINLFKIKMPAKTEKVPEKKPERIPEKKNISEPSPPPPPYEPIIDDKHLLNPNNAPMKKKKIFE